MSDILRMIAARLVCDAERAAQKRRTKLGDELFERIGLISEPLSKFTIEPPLGAAPVREFMQQRRIVGLAALRIVTDK